LAKLAHRAVLPAIGTERPAVAVGAAQAQPIERQRTAPHAVDAMTRRSSDDIDTVATILLLAVNNAVCFGLGWLVAVIVL
jgi:hypothetical protein